MLAEHTLGARLRMILLALVAGMLAACGGGDGPAKPGGPVLQQPGDAAPAVGTLAVTIANLPPGAVAAVRLTGPNDFSRDLGRSQTVTGLVPGTYTITAAPVEAGGRTWVAAPATREIQVSAGSTAGLAVDYSADTVALALARVAAGLSEPVYMAAPDGDARQFIVERAGRILVMEEGALRPRPFLDIRAAIDPAVDGLMSLAFDPGYASNGHFYVYRTDLDRNIAIERYTVSDDPDLANPASALTILRIPHPDAPLHFGGQVAFGPDGHLYAATGDGGLPNDAPGNAQNLDSLLGKMLRLDVGAASAAAPYRIPSTNPYVGQPGRRPEIWASGLRNPWRFSFDGDNLYIADIGQDAVEEIDLVSAVQGGMNYGWNRMEGGACFPARDCERSGLTLPVVEYGHGSAAGSPCSITGGYVYRGKAIPGLAGRYLYSDFCAGFLRSFHAHGGAIDEQRDWNVVRPGQVTSFGRDGGGELYLITLGGEIWKIVDAADR